VLAADRSAKRDRQREELLGRRLGPCELVVVAGRQEERRVQVAVPGVPPRAGVQPVTHADLDGAEDAFGQAVQRHGDVLAELAALRRGDRDGHAAAPAPQLP